VLGEFICVPKGVAHAYLAQSEQAAFLVAFAPAGAEGFFAHDPDAIVACLTERAVLEDPTAPESAYRGSEAIADWARSVFVASPDFNLELLEEWVSPGGETMTTYFKGPGTCSGPLEPPGLAPTKRLDGVAGDGPQRDPLGQAGAPPDLL
jgi:hypothetical protein